MECAGRGNEIDTVSVDRNVVGGRHVIDYLFIQFCESYHLWGSINCDDFGGDFSQCDARLTSAASYIQGCADRSIDAQECLDAADYDWMEIGPGIPISFGCAFMIEVTGPQLKPPIRTRLRLTLRRFANPEPVEGLPEGPRRGSAVAQHHAVK